MAASQPLSPDKKREQGHRRSISSLKEKIEYTGQNKNRVD
jgi:hypothetical protein